MKCIDKTFMTLHHVWRSEVNLVPTEFPFHLLCMMQHIYKSKSADTDLHVLVSMFKIFFSFYIDKMMFFHYSQKNQINIENIINASQAQ